MAEFITNLLQEESDTVDHENLDFYNDKSRGEVVGKLIDSISKEGAKFARLGVRPESGPKDDERAFFNEIKGDIPNSCIEAILKYKLKLSPKEISFVLGQKERIINSSLEFFPFENVSELYQGDGLASYFPRISDGICGAVIEEYLQGLNKEEAEYRKFVYSLIPDQIRSKMQIKRFKELATTEKDLLEIRKDFYVQFKNEIIYQVESHFEVLEKIILNIDYSKCRDREQQLNLLRDSINQINFGVSYITSHRMVKPENPILETIEFTNPETFKLISKLPENLRIGQLINILGLHRNFNMQNLSLENHHLGLRVRALLNRPPEIINKYKLLIEPVEMIQIISNFAYVKVSEKNEIAALMFMNLDNHKTDPKFELRIFEHLLNLAALRGDCVEDKSGRFMPVIRKKTIGSYVDLNFHKEVYQEDTDHNRKVGEILEKVELVVHDPRTGKSIVRRLKLNSFSEMMAKVRLKAEVKLLGY